MTYVDAGSFSKSLLVPGQAYDKVIRLVGLLGRAAGTDNRRVAGHPHLSQSSPVEERLRYVQETISKISMHLPHGFATGLNRQFANLMDSDAWEDDDELVSPGALTAFLNTLFYAKTLRRPGIGTNGRGSITASWTEGGNRLTIECLPSGLASLVLSRCGKNGEVERAAFAPMRPARIREVLVPFDPEVWFDH